MNRFQRIGVAALGTVVLLTARQGLARKWTDISGTYSVEAEYVEVVRETVDGKNVPTVRLRSADGKVFRVALDRLSLADQAYVGQRLDVKGPLAAAAREPVGEPGPLEPLDLTYFSSDFAAAVIVHPRRIALSGPLKAVRQDVIVGELARRIGFDPRKLDRVVLATADLTPIPTPGDRESRAPIDFMETDRFALLLTLAEPGALKPIIAELLDPGYVTATHAGKTYFRQDMSKVSYLPGEKVPIMACYTPDDRTIVFAEESRLLKLLAGAPVKGPFVERLGKLDVNKDVIVVAELRRMPNLVARMKIGSQEGAATALTHLLGPIDKIKDVAAMADLKGSTVAEVALEMSDAGAASSAADAIQEALKVHRKQVAEVRRQVELEFHPPIVARVLNFHEEVIAAITVTQQSNQLHLVLKRPPAWDDLFLFVTPAVDMLEREILRADRVRNFRKISLAMMNYCDAHRSKLPPVASRDPDGKPLLSWRVTLLPFLGYQELYGQFHQDEPWDSPHNAQLVKKMPDVYGIPGQPNTDKTTFMVFTGDGTPFGRPKGPTLEEITDGIAATIMIVDAAGEKAVPWTKPEDLRFDPINPMAALGDIGEGFNAAFVDGGVRHISADIPADVLKALITHNGGESVNADAYLTWPQARVEFWPTW